MPTISITISAGDATLLQECLGKQKNFVDSQVPPQPRGATLAEIKQFIVDKVTEVVVNVKGNELIKTALLTTPTISIS